MSLEDLRKDINRTDREIVKLLDERAAIAKKIAEEKNRLGLPLHNPEREKEVLRGLSALSNGAMPQNRLANIYKRIMTETLELEHDLTPRTPSLVCQGHEKFDLVAEVMENHEVAPGFQYMRLRIPELAAAFSPGQFFQLKIGIGESGPFLRRPFAPSEMSPDGFAFVYAVVGTGTRLMGELPLGSKVQIMAPLGKGYTLAKPGSRVALIGGGCGGPSLGTLAESLAGLGVNITAVIGARSACSLLGKDLLEKHADRFITATDDGSAGVTGNAVHALEEQLGSALSGLSRMYACGPVPMLRAVAALAKKHGIPCEVSLEERMACGFGACVGCVVEAVNPEGGTVFRKVCHDGPVFNAEEIAWKTM